MINSYHKPILIAVVMTILFISCKSKTTPEKAPEYNNELLQKIRAASTAIPGAYPTAINYIKYAESIRKWSDIVEGGGNDPCKMARTAFQIEYPDGWIMVDAGMDKQIAHFFEKMGPQPYDEGKSELVRKAVEDARLILITHEHGDHIAGVIRTANTGVVPRKTILTRQQVNSLINNPQMPELKLDESKSRQYIVADFEDILPVAPGIVLVKAPGHTKGEIVIYARLQNGKEYLFTGDVAWSYKGIEEKKQKPKSERDRIGEDGDQVEKELGWLNDLLTKERMTLLVSHDDIMLPQFAAQGIIGNNLKVNQ